MPFDNTPVEPIVEAPPECKVLRDAADYIERHGWCQNEYSRPTGAVCMIGALISVTSGDSAPRISAATALENYIWLNFPDAPIGSMPYPERWNDSPHRTKEEVIAALRGAADARERGEI